jgi:hypothetical protein
VKKAAFIFVLAATSYQMAHGGQERPIGARAPQTRLVRNDQGQLVQVAWVEGQRVPVNVYPAPAPQNAQADQDANNLGGLLCTIQ